MRKMEFWFLIPTLLTLSLLVALPVFYVIYQSFTDATLLGASSNFVGLTNYAELFFNDSRFWNSVRVTLILSAGTVTLQLLIGLGLAILLHHEFWFTRVCRGFFLVPMVLPPIVVGITWRLLFTPIMPGINYFLSVVGIEGPSWFGDAASAKWTVIVANAWQWTPFVILMLLAGLQSLPTEPYESALIDGASKWQIFKFITLPLLKPIIVYVGIYRVVESLKIFALIYIMTGGGPGTATEPMNFYMWQTAFSSYKVGYASSIVGMMIIMIVCIVSILVGYGRRTGAIR